MTDFSSVEDDEIVYALMHSILGRINDKYRTSSVPLPDRQYAALGAVPHDCEQLTISFIQMYLGPPGVQSEQPQRCNAPRTCVFTIQLVRQVALGGGRANTAAPEPEHIELHTHEKTRDTWMLLDAVLGDNLGETLADVSITDQQGEYQAVVLNVTVQVP